MQKDYLKLLELNSKKFKENYKEIFDMVIYGSFVKGKMNFNDIDIMLIFIETNLEKRLEIAGKFKEIIKEIKNADIKTMNLKELFEAGFLARQGLLIEGISLVKSKSLAEIMGFKGYSLFTYNLKNLNHNEKTKFTYILIGRNSEGIVKSLKGKQLGRGAVKIPIENSHTFFEFLEKWKIDYKRNNILEAL